MKVTKHSHWIIRDVQDFWLVVLRVLQDRRRLQCLVPPRHSSFLIAAVSNPCCLIRLVVSVVRRSLDVYYVAHNAASGRLGERLGGLVHARPRTVSNAITDTPWAEHRCNAAERTKNNASGTSYHTNMLAPRSAAGWPIFNWQWGIFRICKRGTHKTCRRSCPPVIIIALHQTYISSKRVRTFVDDILFTWVVKHCAPHGRLDRLGSGNFQNGHCSARCACC
mmetsp:Transcript_70945/g.122994  ORF Transcript_70945/g.122994 Transcript_70945/m.122994 type:complete len:222 (+) Transcript_70945:214-879(+)